MRLKIFAGPDSRISSFHLSFLGVLEIGRQVSSILFRQRAGMSMTEYEEKFKDLSR